MKKILSFLLAMCCALPLFAQTNKIVIPDLKGYVTLKCDFHIHTVFSDGTVWPIVRIDEAVREGLDAISITDHLEYRPYLQQVEDQIHVSTKELTHNLSYNLALANAKERNIILIRGSEITRSMPPGHHNAIFITDADKLDTPDFMDAFRAAKAQNAFIFWNHPGWLSQQPDTTLWWAEHTQLLEQGMMQGIEVVNGSYFIEAHRWALEKKLTLLGNSDVHAPMPVFAAGQHRTMTLVFAKDRSENAIYEALKDRRTVVYHRDLIIGEEKYLKELFENAVEINVTKTGQTAQITLKNKSDLTFRLKSMPHDARLVYFRNTDIETITIAPQGVLNIPVRLNNGITGGDIIFSVENFLVEPDKGMVYIVKI
jgi:hypothetical protein